MPWNGWFCIATWTNTSRHQHNPLLCIVETTTAPDQITLTIFFQNPAYNQSITYPALCDKLPCEWLWFYWNPTLSSHAHELQNIRRTNLTETHHEQAKTCLAANSANSIVQPNACQQPLKHRTMTRCHRKTNDDCKAMPTCRVSATNDVRQRQMLTQHPTVIRDPTLSGVRLPQLPGPRPTTARFGRTRWTWRRWWWWIGRRRSRASWFFPRFVCAGFVTVIVVVKLVLWHVDVSVILQYEQTSAFREHRGKFQAANEATNMKAAANDRLLMQSLQDTVRNMSRLRAAQT